MQMVPVPSSTFGSFFDGDCYVVLAVSGGWAGEGAEQRAKLTVATQRKFEAGGNGNCHLTSPQDSVHWVFPA